MERLAELYKAHKYAAMSSEINMSGMPTGKGGIDDSMSDIDDSVDIEIEYQALYLENELLIKEARKYINQLPDNILRMVMELKYINGMDEYEISAEVGVPYKQCCNMLKVHWNNVF
jgi:hypothetical protein